ncbi:hypothetical protein FGG78_26485 [Thioclava sp. BHET1]|nr:hypothetical protein FGG78_26485 [Thioclava sp. BHET1]
MGRSQNSTTAWLDGTADQIYEAALGGRAWDGVMRQFRHGFRTGAEALYVVDFKHKTKRYVHIEGVSPAYMTNFAEVFFLRDNPCIGAAELHIPGLIRTNSTLSKRFSDPGILERSAYYNEWRHPQDIHNAIGCTPVAEAGRALNLSILRSRKEGEYDAEELRQFAILARHLTRAVGYALRHDLFGLDHAAIVEALEQLDSCILVLDENRHIHYANAAAERVLRAGDPVSQRAGRIVAANSLAQQQIARLVRDCAEGPRQTGPASCTIDGASGRYEVSGLPIAPRSLCAAGWRRSIMLTIRAVPDEGRDAVAILRDQFGCTPAELRVAKELMAGKSPREISDATGLTYETARWYVKTLLQKTSSKRQSEFVARFSGAPLH